jgi:hypothetical protein
MFRKYPLLLSFVGIFVFGLGSRVSSQDNLDLSKFFPKFPSCRADISPLYNNGQGFISQQATYRVPGVPSEGVLSVASGESVVVVADSPIADCGSVQITMTVSQLIPKPANRSKVNGPPVTKETKEQKRFRKYLEEIRKSCFPFGCIRKPRKFTLNGFEAYEIYPPPTDVPEEISQAYSTIEVHFAGNKKLTIRRLGPFAETESIASRIDYKAVNALLDMYAAKLKLEQRKN